MLIVIEGAVLPDRRKFRPSDWAEILIEGVGLAHFGPNHKIHYTDNVEPATIDGCASIIFDEALERSHPEAYAELLHFAARNNLNIFMKDGSIPCGDGLAAAREHHDKQALVDHDPHLPVEDKKGWHVLEGEVSRKRGPQGTTGPLTGSCPSGDRAKTGDMTST